MEKTNRFARYTEAMLALFCALILALSPLTTGRASAQTLETEAASSSSQEFSDVVEGSWYEEAVYEMASLGYIAGYSNGEFGVGDTMTREQFVTILWRIACPEEYAAYDDNADDETGLKDAKDGMYYTAAVNWAVDADIMSGYSNGEFGVGDSLTFEQLCTVLSRYACGGDDALEQDISKSSAKSYTSRYSDSDDISSWALKGVGWCTREGYVSGNGDGTVAPLEKVRRERAATVIYRFLAAGAFEGDGGDDGDLVVHFLDVGQGDATFIELPNGETMLIDASTEEYGDVVASYIEDLGYDSIDYVVATHPHDDHIGGMPEVLTSFDVGEIWAPSAVTTTQVYEDFLDAVEGAGLSINTAVAGKTILVDGDLSIEILGPASDCDSDDMNDWSVVILVTYDGTSFLFCGDASADDIYDWTEGAVDVLKVAHHGSYTGTTDELAEKLSPEIAVISYGEGNSYGHPYQSVLDALEAVGADIYGTAVNGTVVVTSDGVDIWVECDEAGTVVAGGDSDSSNDDDDDASSLTDATDTTVVYITATGSKYHSTTSCSGLSNAKALYETTLVEAIENGYEACKICW